MRLELEALGSTNDARSGGDPVRTDYRAEGASRTATDWMLAHYDSIRAKLPPERSLT